MNLSLFDLHCDTAYEMLRQKQPLTQNKLAVSLQNATNFTQYTQVMALWTDHNLDDEEGWSAAMEMLDNLICDDAVTEGLAKIVTRYTECRDSATLLLGIEDARILNGDVARVDRLYECGIRILTPLWKGLTCIGGSHDTSVGLTAFGRSAINRAVSIGMIPDISHASVESVEEIFEIAKHHSRPVIASHSNAYALCPVSRNLRDKQIESVLASGGVIGINLYGAFLNAQGPATIGDVLRHIDYFLTLGAENALCLGCDMDGCRLPDEIPNLSALPRLAEAMAAKGYSESLIERIFFGNAARFAQKYIF